MVEFSSNVMVRDCGFWGRMLSRLQRDTHAFARPMRLCRIQPGLFLGGHVRNHMLAYVDQGRIRRHSLCMAVTIAAA